MKKTDIYSTIDKKHHEYLKNIAEGIRQRRLEAVTDTSRELNEARERIGIPAFLQWQKECVPCTNCFASLLMRYVDDRQAQKYCDIDELRAKATLFLAAVSPYGTVPGGSIEYEDVMNLFTINMKLMTSLKDRMYAEMTKPQMTVEEREESDAMEELEDELVYSLENWISVMEDIKRAITGGNLSQYEDLQNPVEM